MRRGHPTLVLSFLVAASLTSAQEPTTDRAQRYLGHGTLHLKLPRAWKSSMRMSPDQPATLELLPATGDDFKMMLTVMPPRAGYENVLDSATMRKSVEDNGKGPLAQAVEKTLDLKELKGPESDGFHYSLTDKDPGDSYKYLTQGQARIGTLLAAYTILQRTSNAAVRNAGLEIVRTATLVK